MVDPRRRAVALGRYWRTARHLRPVQIYNRVARCLPRRGIVPEGAPLCRIALAGWQGAGPRSTVFTGERQVRLLHREGELSGWDPQAMPRLWRYHLHYFDDLASPHFAAITARWIAENPARGKGPGWEPYPLSRRIPNWIAWLLAGNSAAPGMVESLEQQASSLDAQLEYHLLGNHLLANLRALVFAGCFFEQRAEWLERGVNGISQELGDQLLPGGAHCERSPMYHALMLTDLLDLLNLSELYPGVIAARHLQHWRRSAARMLTWLIRMCHPDGAIAFFQDAAFDMAPAPASILSYARRLGIHPAAEEEDHSGYVRLEIGQTVLLADVGTPGPAHQPGHAHAGALSFELSHQGERLLVNSGTSTYEPSPERDYERSTCAHNTLRLDGCDQSEMWAAFRVGRRASVREELRGSNEVVASHDGYAPVRHRRRIRLERDHLMIEDQLAGSGRHDVELFFHGHPDVTFAPEDGVWRGRHRQGPWLRLHPPAQMEAAVEPAQWRPEFGLRLPNQRLRVQATLALPTILQTRIELST